MHSSSQSLSRKRSRQEDHPPPRPAPASRSASSEHRRSLRQQPRRVVDQPQYSAPSGASPFITARIPTRAFPASAPTVTPIVPNSGNVRPRPNNETPARCPPSNTVRSEMDLLLYDELYGRVQFDCEALWNRFDSAHSDAVCTRAAKLGLHDGLRWARWPSDTAERNVFTFLAETFDSLRPFIPATTRVFRFCTSGDVPLKNGDCQRKTDLIFTSTDLADHRIDLSWAHVRIVGELKANSAKSDCDSTIVQLANYAREVFGNQPWRRWVLCFTLCGSHFRVWQFDRGGAVASTTIDIHAQWERFLTVFLSFATMGATEIGFDPSIRCIVDGVETTFDSTLAARSTEPLRPFVRIPSGLPVPGDVSPQGEVLPSITNLKPDSWSRLELQPRSMAPRWAIVTPAAICSRARLWETDSEEWTYVVKDQWRAPERQPEGEILHQCGCKAVGVPLRIWHGDILTSDGTPDDIICLRPAIPASTAAAQADTLPNPDLRKVSPTSEHLLRAGCTPLNRVHTRLVIAPVGLSLLQFASYTELLTTLRDAITGHQHMYTVHHILHRDVSVNNIIITASTGVLIDFDLAIDTTRDGSSGATHRTGTFDFMARGVLEGDVPHTPLHDLESFFYVLLWLCIYYGKGGQRRSPEPLHTVFADPSTGKNPWEAAKNAKWAFAWRDKFNRQVLPTLAKDAKCARFVLQKWHRLLFSEDRQQDDADEGDDDSDEGDDDSDEGDDDWDEGDDDSDEGDDDSGKQERQQDGEQQQEQDLEERIQRKYKAVLELLDMGIERLRRRAHRRERRAHRRERQAHRRERRRITVAGVEGR
jgi:hypothetical protein